MKLLITLLFAAFIAPATGFAQTSGPKDKPATKDSIVYVEKMPDPGYNVGEYLGKNINYPAKAIDSNIQGKVVLKFVVNEDGSISNVTIMRSVHYLIDKEALRVVRSMPPWKPGESKGKKVKVYYTLPVKFTLPDDEKEASPKKK
jgi:protein TonB